MKRFKLLVLFVICTPLMITHTQVVQCASATPPAEIIEATTVAPISQLNEFLDHIGFVESSNNYNCINSIGYLGKYQFGKSTLRNLGFNVSVGDFLSDSVLQEQAMLKLLTHNKIKLQPFIDEWDGDTIQGIRITESGILAAAHIAGQGNVRNFFRKQANPQDTYGTSLTDYMDTFGGYDLQLNQ